MFWNVALRRRFRKIATHSICKHGITWRQWLHTCVPPVVQRECSCTIGTKAWWSLTSDFLGTIEMTHLGLSGFYRSELWWQRTWQWHDLSLREGSYWLIRTNNGAKSLLSTHDLYRRKDVVPRIVDRLRSKYSWQSSRLDGRTKLYRFQWAAWSREWLVYLSCLRIDWYVSFSKPQRRHKAMRNDLIS